MRTMASILLICILLALALMPWVVSSCASQPLLPPELEERRDRYEATVAAAQDATIEAMRLEKSSYQVMVIGPSGESDLPIESPNVSITGTPTSTNPVTATLELTQSVITIQAVVLTRTVTPTQRVIVVSAGSTPSPPTSTPSSTVGVPHPTRPSGLVRVEDVITDQMLTDQVKLDAEDASLADLTIHITDSGLQALTTVSLFPGIRRPIEVRGTFVADKDSLIAQVSSIFLDGIDVTEQYRWQLEDNFNTSLYHLLPQRYVQSFVLTNGQVTVVSEMRP